MLVPDNGWAIGCASWVRMFALLPGVVAVLCGGGILHGAVIPHNAVSVRASAPHLLTFDNHQVEGS